MHRCLGTQVLLLAKLPFLCAGGSKVSNGDGEQHILPQHRHQVKDKTSYNQIILCFKLLTSFGFSVDVAFITMCAFAIDELFSDQR